MSRFTRLVACAMFCFVPAPEGKAHAALGMPPSSRPPEGLGFPPNRGGLEEVVVRAGARRLVNRVSGLCHPPTRRGPHPAPHLR